MTEQHAAEAATIEAMHTGDYARTVADADDAPEPPARHVDGDDYTYPAPAIGGSRDYWVQRADELEAERDGLRARVATLERNNATLRAELKAWGTMPAEALIAYWDAHDDGDDTLGDWINELRHGVNVGRYYAGLEPL